jgi:hypothetical protein
MATCLAELAGDAPMWLGPGLESVAVELPDRAAVDAAQARIIVVRAHEVDAAGHFTPTPQATGPELVAIALLDAAPPDRVVARCADQGQAQYILCELGLLEVSKAGLVIVKLARGVSARDLQGRVEPTLLVSPRLDEIGTPPPRA